MVRSLVLLASLASLALAGWLLVGGPGGPPAETAAPPLPADASPAPPPPPEARHREVLREVHAAVLADPAVREALALEASVPPDQAAARWQRARSRYREIVTEAELGFSVWRLSLHPPDPAVLSRVSELLLVERLLTAAFQREAPPLFGAEDAPGLERVLRRGVAARFAPVFERVHPEESHLDHRRRVRESLSEEGREWVALRSLEDIHIPEGPAAGWNTRFLLENFAGVGFVDPAAAVPGVLEVGIYPERQRLRAATATRRMDVPLEHSGGDLVLALNLWRLFHVNHARLELVGSEETTTVLLSREDAEPWGPGPGHTTSSGYTLRVREGALPAGLRRLRLRLVGLQSIGTPEANANLGEVLQLVAGPLPEALADHGWDRIAPGEDELDAVERERLEARLAPVEAALAAAPEDAGTYLEAALVYREFGRVEDARAAAAAAVERDPDLAAAWNLLGEVAWEAGDEAAALRHWWHSLDLDPAGRARELLERHAPAATAEVHWVETVEEFLRVAVAVQAERRGEPVDADLAALRAPRGFRVVPRVIWEAVEAGEPAALEVGLGLLPPGELEEHLGVVAEALRGIHEPATQEAVVERLRRAVRPANRARMRVLIPALREVRARAEGLVAWRTRALLDALGARGLPPLEPAELDSLLEAVFEGRVGREAPRSAFHALGREGARRYLLGALRSPRLGVVAVAVEAFPFFGRPEDVPALLEARGGPHGESLRPILERSFELMTGEAMTAQDGHR